MNTPSPAEEQAAAPLTIVRKIRDDGEFTAATYLMSDGSTKSICEDDAATWNLKATISALNTRIEELEGQVAEQHARILDLNMLAHKWMVAHDRRQAGLPVEFPKPVDLPESIARAEQAEALLAAYRAAHPCEDPEVCEPEQAATSAEAHLAELRNEALEEAAAHFEAQLAMTKSPTAEAIFPAIIADLRALKSTQEPTQS